MFNARLLFRMENILFPGAYFVFVSIPRSGNVLLGFCIRATSVATTPRSLMFAVAFAVDGNRLAP